MTLTQRASTVRSNTGQTRWCMSAGTATPASAWWSEPSQSGSVHTLYHSLSSGNTSDGMMERTIAIRVSPHSHSSYTVCGSVRFSPRSPVRKVFMHTHLRATGHHLPYVITQCYLPPNTSQHATPNPSQKGWCLIYLPRRDGRSSWPRWLVTYQDGLPAHRQSPNQVLTEPDVQQLKPWHHQTVYTILWHSQIHHSVHNCQVHTCGTSLVLFWDFGAI